MRHATERCLRLVKEFESFQPKPYLCPAGYWTIGYGHVIQHPDDYKNGITEAEALEFLARDIAVAERAVLRYIAVTLTDGQFDALVSFTFNLGAGALQRSTLRRKINREDHEAIPAELQKWVWGGGHRLRGLEKRRKAEAALYQS